MSKDQRPDNQGAAPEGGADPRPVLTTRQGHPVHDNQSLRSVGERGPATLENYQFIEKITHFDRERIPERVVHARGTGAHGWFEAYGKIGNEPASRYTRAKVLNQTGVRYVILLEGVNDLGTLTRDGPVGADQHAKLVGDILGAGVYAVTGQMAGVVGGIVWLPFLVAFIVATLTAPPDRFADLAAVVEPYLATLRLRR